MIDSILVLNAGSSSLKFSIFGADRVNGGLLVRGQVEGIGTAPRFVLRSASGERIDEQTLAAGADHEQALGVVVDRTALISAMVIWPLSGIVSCMAVCSLPIPSRSTRLFSKRWNDSFRSPRCINRTTWQRCGR